MCAVNEHEILQQRRCEIDAYEAKIQNLIGSRTYSEERMFIPQSPPIICKAPTATRQRRLAVGAWQMIGGDCGLYHMYVCAHFSQCQILKHNQLTELNYSTQFVKKKIIHVAAFP